ncbi:MAG: hypothetical protein ACK5PP_12800 [Acidimicrobiales bacterium]
MSDRNNPNGRHPDRNSPGRGRPTGSQPGDPYPGSRDPSNGGRIDEPRTNDAHRNNGDGSDGRSGEVSGRSNDRDPVVGGLLAGLAVPEHRPGFWEVVNAQIATEATSTGGLVELDRARGARFLPAMRPGRARWLAVAAAAVAVLGGTVLWQTAGVTGERTTGYTNGGAVAVGDTTGPAADPGAQPDYGAPWRPVTVLRGGRLVGVSPDQRILVEEPLADEGGCENGTVYTVSTYRLDGSIVATDAIGTLGENSPVAGLSVASYVPFRTSSEENLAAATFGCEGLETLAVGGWLDDLSLAETPAVPDGSASMADMHAVVVGDGAGPVWSPDGRTVTTSTGGGRPEQLVYRIDSMDVEIRTRAGQPGDLLAELVGGTSVYSVDGNIVVDVADGEGGVATVPTGPDTGTGTIIGTAVDADAGRATVYGEFGLVEVQADPDGGPPTLSQTFDDAGAIIDADYAPNGDLLVVAAGPEGQGVLGVAPSGSAGRITWMDIVSDSAAATSTIGRARWVSGGSTIAVSGGDGTGASVVMILRPEAGLSDTDLAPDGGPVVKEVAARDHIPGAETPSGETSTGSGNPMLTGIASVDADRSVIVFLPHTGTEVVDVVDMYPAEGVSNILVGTIEVDGRPAVVWAHTRFEVGNEPAGETSLVIQPMNSSSFDPSEAVTIDERTMTGLDGSWMYTTAVAQVDGNLWLERAFNQGACYWIDVVDMAGNPIDMPDNPAPRPDVDLDQLSAEVQNGPSGDCVETEPLLGPPPVMGE